MSPSNKPVDRREFLKLTAVAGASVIAGPAAVARLKAAGGQQTFVESGAIWKYRDDGSDQGTAWTQVAFNDSEWSAGPALLGYGYQGDLVTIVSYGSDPNNKPITTYFRRTFVVEDPTRFDSLLLSLRRDDGAVVYLNGTEVWRSNMPTGAITAATHAATSASDDGATWFQATVNPTGLLVSGTNVVAVEIHQVAAYSSDIIFDFQLIASGPGVPATVTRGPYLQSGTATSVVVRWRTDVAIDSCVRYGSAAGSLTRTASDPAFTTEHEVLVSGLTPGTRYFYSIGTLALTLAGNDADAFFVTNPPTGSNAPVRIWALGCSGTAGYTARMVRIGYQKITGRLDTNVCLMLGDNAYNSGTDAEYQAAVFDMFPTMLQKTPLWPTLGNHDTADSTNPPPTLPYFNMFTLPAQGEAGGYFSGTEKYYSYDCGNVHFVVMDAMSSSRLAGGPMLNWLTADLAATNQPWIIAYWHHPAYSKGNHDSDVDIESIEMRGNALPIFEDFGVDLVLNAHSHTYERSFLLDGHYGLSTTLQPSMKIDAGTGREDGTGAYHKPTFPRAPHQGTVYAVAATSGQVDTSGPLNHPAICTTITVAASLVIDVNNNRLDARFVDIAGVVQDHFTIIKGGVLASVAVPNVVGATQAAATATLTNAGLVLGAVTTAASATVQAGLVISENPASSTPVATGSAVSLVVSSGPATVAVPNVVGATQAAATATLTNAGLVLGAVTTAASATVRAGLVISENPASKTPVAPGSAVSLVVSSGSPLPAAPTSLTATANGTRQITLSWSDNSSNETGFKIERARGNGAFSQIATVGANVKTYVNSGLARSTSYRYRVRAYNASGNSAYSNIVTAVS